MAKAQLIESAVLVLGMVDILAMDVRDDGERSCEAREQE
jgi:hypothetical protein